MIPINNNEFNTTLQRVSDLGGQRILGMGGSLRAYIETGNQYDSFYSRGSQTQNAIECRKEKDKKTIGKFIKAGIVIAGVAAGAVALKKFKPNLFKGIKISNPFKNIKISNPFKNFHPIQSLKNFHPIQKLTSLFKGKNNP